MSTLFTVDEEALAEAFQVDESKFQMDLSGLSGMSVDTSALAGAFSLDMGETDLTDLIDLEELFPELAQEYLPEMQEISERVDLTFSPEETQAMFQNLIQGFQESLAGNPEFNVAGLATGFSDYLATEDAANRLAAGVQELLRTSVQVDVPYTQVLGMAGELLDGYRKYAEANKIEETTAASLLGYFSEPPGTAEPSGPGGGPDPGQHHGQCDAGTDSDPDYPEPSGRLSGIPAGQRHSGCFPDCRGLSGISAVSGRTAAAV